MICRDCQVEAAPKYREHCPRCGGELIDIAKCPPNIMLTVAGIEVRGLTLHRY